MKNINFNVSQDTIEKLSEDVIISDSYNYVCLIFNFDSSWSQYNVKKATFFSDYEDGEEKYEADIVNNVCVVPFEILKKSKFKDSFFIGVYGQVIEDEILKQRNTTNMISFKLRQGAYFANALNPVEIEPSAYDLYLAKLNEVFEKGLNEYNKNADEKIKEINNKVSDLEKIEDNIEQIQKNVQASEQNAKTSETNAKTSEQNAQKSAEDASEVLTNVTTIQEDINKSKGEINTAKESVDKSVEKVYSAVTEATNQAKESEKQAGIATSKANQTSTDKSAVETMRNEVSSMKTSIEQIKTDTQAIKDDVETAKNETLEAKEEVENSLENERIISDKKYARAIDSDILEINNYGKVECDNEGYMKDIEIESTLPEITQDTREGYNKFNIEAISSGGIEIETGKILANGSWRTSEYIAVKELTEYLFSWQSDSVFFQISYAFYDENKNFISAIKYEKHNIYSLIIETVENTKYIRIAYSVKVSGIDVIRDNIQLIEGTEEKPYEEYGASPSLDYLSEFKNTLSSFNIKNTIDEVEKYNKQITLPENKFLGTFNGYKNYLQNNKLKSNLKIVEFDGTENWSVDEVENKFAIYNTGIKPNPNALFQICTHFKTYNEYANINGSFSLGNGYIRMHNDNNMTLEEWKAYLAQQKEAGTPLQILYISSNEEEISLEDINLPLYKGINNISSEDLKLNFKYNISIEKYIEDNTVTERKISDSKYPKALKTEVKDVQQTQIYAENLEVEGLKIKGVELTQKVREGYNKLNIQDYTKNSPYVVSSSDSEIILQSVADVTYEQTIFFNNIDLKANIEYTLTALMQILSGSLFNMTGQIELYTSSKSWIKVITTGDINGYNKKVNFTVDEDGIYSIRFKLTSTGDTSSESFSINLSNFMIYEGIEDKPYEQYGATPSLDFPSEIQVVKEQNISINGKNKCRGWMNTTTTVKYGSAFLIKADLKPNTKYTISFLTPSFEAEYYRTEELTSNWFTVINNGKRQSFTFTTKADISNAYKEYNGEYGYLLFKNAIDTPSPANFSDVMLVEGDTDVPYEAYYGHDVNIPLTNSSIGNYFDVIDRENKVQDKVIQELILTGNENYNFNDVENGIYQYSITPAKKPIYINDSIIRAMSNYFKGVGRDGSWNIDNSITTNMSNIRFMTSQYTTVEDFKVKIKELYEAGTPVKVYYVAETADKISLSEEVKQELDKFKLYDGLNNIFIDNGSLSFKYNKSLLRAFEEQSELSANLLERVQALEQAQVNQVGGN